jgi:SAM-dependent methyltransferase
MLGELFLEHPGLETKGPENRMKLGDRLLQHWRISTAARWIPRGARLLDIGCADGAIFHQLRNRISGGVGIDPALREDSSVAGGQLIRGIFPTHLPDRMPFDSVTMLAVLEHIPRPGQEKLAQDIVEYLKPGGRLIVTVPSPAVDFILSFLRLVRLVDGMSLDEHYGFRPADTPQIFTDAGLKLEFARRFQLGLNNLFVFQKPSERHNRVCKVA